MNVDAFRKRIIVRIIEWSFGDKVTHDHDVCAAVICKFIAEYFDTVIGQNHHACARGHFANDVARGREVFDIIVAELIVKNSGILTTLNR